MEQQTDSKLGKEYVKAVYRHPVYLTYMQTQFTLVAQSCLTLCKDAEKRNVLFKFDSIIAFIGQLLSAF